MTFILMSALFPVKLRLFWKTFSQLQVNGKQIVRTIFDLLFSILERL